VLDEQGTILHINPHFTKITGYDSDDIPHLKDWFLRAYPDEKYRDSVVQEWKQAKEDNVVERTFSVTCKNGTVKTIEFHPFFPQDNTAMVSLSDVSDRKAAEQATQTSEKTIESIFKAAPTGIGMVVNHHIMKTNDLLCQMVGYAEHELIDHSSRMLYPTDEDYESVGKEKYRQINKTGTGTVETRWQHKNGQIINVLLSSTPINPNDWSEGVTFTALDITHRKQMESALKKSETRYREFFDEILSGAFISALDGTLLDCNQEYLKIFGFASKSDALKRNVNQLYQTSKRRTEFLTQLKQDKGIKHFESEMVKTDGTPIHIMENAVGVFDEQGKLEMIRGYLSDITEIKKMEVQLQQAQKMEAIGTLVGGISHDFNNLIQAIGGYTELLQMDKDPSHPDYEHIRSLRGVSKRAGDLVQQLLIFSREAKTTKRAVDVNKEIGQANNLLGKTIPRMITIELNLSKDLWSIYADPLQIEQILLNLGGNAADAMPDGGMITIETQNLSFIPGQNDNNLGLDPGKYILIKVQDTGYGMAKTVKDKIFEPFFTTKQIGKGTGLGLSSVYGIVSGHNGTIICQSQVDQGTCFYIYLPAFENEQPEKQQQEHVNLEQGKETILLVDDESAIQEVAARSFHRLGYTLVAANTGEEAIGTYEILGEKIDLVILDLSMPGMGGYKCLKKLQTINPEVKVLIASGYSADTTVNDCMKLGALGYIRKPYKLNQMFSYVRSILDESKA